jgi:hypothetical protein
MVRERHAVQQATPTPRCHRADRAAAAVTIYLAAAGSTGCVGRAALRVQEMMPASKVDSDTISGSPKRSLEVNLR